MMALAFVLSVACTAATTAVLRQRLFEPTYGPLSVLVHVSGIYRLIRGRPHVR